MVDRSPGKSDSPLSANVQVFEDYLAETGQSFLLLDEAGGQQVHVRFTGPFEGRDVFWDCRFLALDFRSGRTRRGHDNDPPGRQCSYIEIGQPGERGVPLRVGLKLARIDVPSIEKMIVMIRNYKRLRPGRHEFGHSNAPSTG